MGDKVRTAACRCGTLTARCEGEPVRVSVCHCHDCQRRSGSAFAAQVRFPTDKVTVAGETRRFDKVSDDGNVVSFDFCPGCGSTIAYRIDDQPELTAIPLGAFASTDFPVPAYSVYEARKHPWTAVLGDGVEHYD